MSLVRVQGTRGWVRFGEVLVHEPIASKDVPRLRMLCYESALKVGLGVERALDFVVAVDQGMWSATRIGDGRLILTVIYHHTDSLVARFARRRIGMDVAEVGSSGRLTLRSDRRGTTLQLIVSVRDREQSPARSWSPPNRSRFREARKPNRGRFS